jgi:hypothetical protein
MRHGRHYTLEEAQATLGWVVERIERLRRARDELTDEQARADAAPANGGGKPGAQVGRAFVRMQRLLGELAAHDVVLRDLDRGLVDFPALRDDREVYLCWEEGEDAIAFWHEADAGHAGRQPL